MYHSRQQWLVAGWLGPSVTVRVRAIEPGNGFFPFFFFFKSDIFVYMSDLNIGLVRHPGLSWVILGYSVTFEGNTGQPSTLRILPRLRRQSGDCVTHVHNLEIV